MKLIRRITIEPVDDGQGGQDDIIVELANGKIVQISPEFNCVNVWASMAQFDDREYSADCLQVLVEMGGRE